MLWLYFRCRVERFVPKNKGRASADVTHPAESKAYPKGSAMATIAATHSVVESRPSARPFGAGLVRCIPFAVTAPGFVEPSDEDLATVGQLFAGYVSEPEPDWDTLAGEAEYIASVEHLGPPPAGPCARCGEPSESLSWGMCASCFEDAATDASTRCATCLRRVYRTP
jgi:hypothetical protein